MSLRKSKFRKVAKTSKVVPRALAFLLAVGLGIYLLSSCHAATVATSHEAENGKIGGNACSTSDSNASGGSAVKSGGCTSETYSCIVLDAKGNCPSDAGYTNHPRITGIGNLTDNGNPPVISSDIWSGNPSYSSTLYANSPSDWKVVANVNNTSGGGVEAYPNVGWYPTPAETPIDSYSSITSSWNVAIPTDTSTTAGWAGYDLWFNGPWGNNPNEVMILPDITANSDYDCDAVTTATFSGMPWHLCVFGSERVWKPGTDDQHLINQASGSVNVLAMLKWMEQNGYLPKNSTWFAASFGFEICNTSGTTQTFQVNGFTWDQQQ